MPAVTRLGSLALLVVMLVGCSTAPLSTSSPSSSAAPTPSFEALGSPSPSGTPAAPAIDFLPFGSLATVTVDELRIRKSPGLAGEVTAVASAGEVVAVSPYVGYRMPSDGFDWYAVTFAPGYRDWPALPEAWEHGWVAAGPDDAPYLQLLPPRCPTGEPDLQAVTSITGWERLSCFGDRPLTLTGTWGCQGCGGTTMGNFEPRWLAYPIQYPLLWVDWTSSGGVGTPLGLRLAPESGLTFPTEPGPIMRITGHFDDPASTTCVMAAPDIPPEVAADTAETFCREQFVVDAFAVIGTDPEFDLGAPPAP